ncbi:MAG: PfkB family carbohydrate kinase [Anaerolineaceae bacterium]|nr:PfkB family carbohydrate kinase [Anaerolineaceae bacterium]
MQTLIPIEPIDYLVIGHVTEDLTPEGPTPGGTASYAALTARALGMRVGIVTSYATGRQIPQLEGISIVCHPSTVSTTFENIHTPDGRIQIVHHVAPTLNLSMVPETWRSAPIVHLGPIAREIDTSLVRAFPNAVLGFTLQGWLREWNGNGRVHFSQLPEAAYLLQNASIAILSIEDVAGDESYIEEIASAARILVVTEGDQGARVYWYGDVRRYRPPVVQEVDPIGAGDIFAATYFVHYHMARDPWEAARVANLLASQSVTRRGLAGVPTPDEARATLIEVIQKQ